MPAWFDAHLDLAYLAAVGRNMDAPLERAGGPSLPAAVTLPSLRDGNVTHCLATIFTEADGADPRASYVSGDAESAHLVGLIQLDVYRRWIDEGKMARLGEKVAPQTHVAGRPKAAPLYAGVLIEGADPIHSPEELAWWKQQGAVAVGLAWWKDSRYAAGNGNTTPSAGLSDIGRALVKEMDRLGVVHDVSHLSDRSLAELLDATGAAVVATHSNSRGVMGEPANQRHLTDATIREIGRRGGVVGLNLLSKFLVKGGKGAGSMAGEDGVRATMADCFAHIDRVCNLTGSCRHVGLGSDMDGGFDATRLPEGINRPKDLVRLTDELSRRNWGDEDVRGFAWGNWARFWKIA